MRCWDRRGRGKTTLLNIVSGLLSRAEGQVLLDGRDVTRLPTAQRNIAQVFQFPVIYDTMTVFDNFAFPLRNRKVGEAGGPPPGASGGGDAGARPTISTSGRQGLAADAKQKISLGRGLVRSDVAAILFDEPLTVIDPHLKWTLRRKLKEIHQELKLTLIYVTHDQGEALTFADKVVALHEGRVVQVGSPTDLFEHPAHTFVGHFIGSPGMNILPCADRGIERAPSTAAPSRSTRTMRTARAGSRANWSWGSGPSSCATGRSATDGFLPAEVTSVEDLGDYKIVTARLAGHIGEGEGAATTCRSAAVRAGLLSRRNGPGSTPTATS